MWLARVGGSFRKARRERELAAELDSHLAMHVHDNLSLGMTQEEARRAVTQSRTLVEELKASRRHQVHQQRQVFELDDQVLAAAPDSSDRLAHERGNRRIVCLEHVDTRGKCRLDRDARDRGSDSPRSQRAIVRRVAPIARASVPIRKSPRIARKSSVTNRSESGAGRARRSTLLPFNCRQA